MRRAVRAVRRMEKVADLALCQTIRLYRLNLGERQLLETWLIQALVVVKASCMEAVC
jgi:hypothetical protein